MDLTDTDRALLDLEAKAWRFPGAHESAIREATGLSWTAAYQRLNRLADLPAAMSYAPIACRRLRDRRAKWQRSRRVAG